MDQTLGVHCTARSQKTSSDCWGRVSVTLKAPLPHLQLAPAEPPRTQMIPHPFWISPTRGSCQHAAHCHGNQHVGQAQCPATLMPVVGLAQACDFDGCFRPCWPRALETGKQLGRPVAKGGPFTALQGNQETPVLPPPETASAPALSCPTKPCSQPSRVYNLDPLTLVQGTCSSPESGLAEVQGPASCSSLPRWALESIFHARLSAVPLTHSKGGGPPPFVYSTRLTY